MKRALSWLADSADAVIGLGLAVFASVLGILGGVPGYVVTNVTVLTLATLAFVLLRDRQRQKTAARKIERSVTNANVKLLAHLKTVKILEGDEITRALAESRSQTEKLVFKGATGTFTRAVALPECLKAAGDKHGTLEACIEIFDPGNARLLEGYVGLYKSFAAGPEDPLNGWSVDGTRREILATILAACWRREQHRNLEIEVYLSPALTTFRWDLTSASLIITQVGPRFPAIYFGRDDPYYEHWKTELRASTQASKKLRLDNVGAVRLGDNPGAGTARELFALLEVPIPDSYSDEDVADIIKLARLESNPYR